MSIVFIVASAWAGKATNLTEMSFSLPEAGLCPGEKLQLDVKAIDDRGKVVTVKLGPRSGLGVRWEIAEVGERGLVEMPLDPRSGWSKDGTLSVFSLTNPSIQTEGILPMRYDCSVVVDLSGREGDFGERGSDGQDVADGKGGDGRRGTVGQAGGRAPEVHIRTTLVTEPRTGAAILQVEITALGKEEPRYAAIEPHHGELVVKVNGGTGGAGGEGGAAGLGSLSSGRPGDGGEGGNGGAGGVVMVFADESAQGQLRAIVVENGGGQGGGGGRGGARQNNSPGDATNGNTGRVGQVGLDGPAPEVQGAKIGPMW